MKKPTLKEVSDYIELKGYEIDPNAFMAYNESKGWLVGRTPMKSWKGALSTWNLRNKPKIKLGTKIANESDLDNLGY